MNYIKIANLLDGDGVANYKGLDINKIVAGSQIYQTHGTAYFIYDGEIIQHQDVAVITEEEYNSIKNREIPKSDVEILKDQVNNITLAMASFMGM